MIINARRINFLEEQRLEEEKVKLTVKLLERERKEIIKSIQMWLILHPDDYKHIDHLIVKLGKINKELENHEKNTSTIHGER